VKTTHNRASKREEDHTHAEERERESSREREREREFKREREREFKRERVQENSREREFKREFKRERESSRESSRERKEQCSLAPTNQALARLAHTFGGADVTDEIGDTEGERHRDNAEVAWLEDGAQCQQTPEQRSHKQRDPKDQRLASTHAGLVLKRLKHPFAIAVRLNFVPPPETDQQTSADVLHPGRGLQNKIK
jgi:hypothetical protein